MSDVQVDEDVAGRRLEDSAMACMEAHIPYWWIDQIDDGCGDAEYYVVRRADPWDDESTVLGSERCADYDAMMERAATLNEALARGGRP